MRWGVVFIGLAAALSASGCERLGMGPRSAKSAPAQAPAPAPDLTPYRGLSYAAFLQQPGMERFAPDALGLDPEEATRFRALMTPATTAELISGGGAEALVFTGCGPGGCEEAIAVFAVDATSGSAFLALRDQEGAEVLAPNPRVEALLGLMSPSRRWDAPPRERISN